MKTETDFVKTVRPNNVPRGYKVVAHTKDGNVIIVRADKTTFVAA